ncbi:uncharacterized protein LOC134538106 [Bacillus rossius redtenbacheri]|uniref:uncharacterized protein LOC134538106 n=1 Tax=Bacillus rossius redtenbacheri TaxID=93214 RepID=UPI002FDEDB38
MGSGTARLIARYIKKNDAILSCMCRDVNFSWHYSAVLGFLGMVFNVLDFSRLLIGGPSLTEQVLSKTCYRIRIGVWLSLDERSERVLAMLAACISAPIYYALLFGLFKGEAWPLVPYLVFQSATLGLHCALFAVNLCVQGVHMSRLRVFRAVCLFHNWVQVLCVYQSMLTFKDYCSAQ